MEFQAAIFDMDGLLLDTERVCMRVFQEACAACELPFYQEVYLSIIGCNAKTINGILSQAYADDLPRLHNQWRQQYNAVVMHQAIPHKEGVITLLEWLKARSIRLAVATSTQKELALIKLQLAGLDHYFENITTGCEVSHGKPDPEIYLLAAQRLGVEPSQCLAFEDSNNGIKAAMAAKMHAFQIPDLVKPNPEVIALGHPICTRLDHVIELL
ncbi:HAD family phosphatase (plasmid) [Vibrio sp. HDW18]|uniref:HAD family hydrolase n=1 Tax=Vibrio sp. HDW18 TaxID=2714948 RepID=UPI001407AC0E|nr:HAD family phosphatase [Vibrio sp. HDW18]QIL86806.1 HAD family phosphatase [Vibrio sp. HDW18]